MPWLVGALVGTLFLKEADDLAETLNGERSGLPVTQLLLIAGLGYAVYKGVKG